MISFKVLLLGDSGTGKTSFVELLKTKRFLDDHIPTMGADVHPLYFRTSYGEITLKLWDIAGRKELSGNLESYFVKADAAILMFSEESKYPKVKEWNDKISSLNLPTIVLKNKCDILDNENLVKSPTNKLEHFHCGISVKENSMVNYSIVHLLRTLTGNDDLAIIT